jgi:hypothetical protein
MKRTIRTGLGKGRGKGYKNILPGHDKRVHRESGWGMKQPQRIAVNGLPFKRSNPFADLSAFGFKRIPAQEDPNTHYWLENERGSILSVVGQDGNIQGRWTILYTKSDGELGEKSGTINFVGATVNHIKSNPGAVGKSFLKVLEEETDKTDQTELG